MENEPNYLKDYKANVLSVIPFFKPVPFEETYNGMQTWLKRFSQKLKTYNLAIRYKKLELLKKAKKDAKIDLKK